MTIELDELVSRSIDWLRSDRPDLALIHKPPDIIDWAENHFYIIETKAPIKFEPHQKIILRLMTETVQRDDGLWVFKWKTCLYSTIKKSGKCVMPETLIQMADGTRKQAKNIVRGDLVLSWDGSGIVPDTVAKTQVQQPEPLVRVMTKRGRELITTAHHPYLVRGDKRPPAFAAKTKSGLQDRWVNASDLEPKDAVRIALDYATSKPCDTYEMWLLGLYIGDGSQGNISSDCNEVLDKIRLRYEITYRGQYDYYIKGIPDFLRKHEMLNGGSGDHTNFCNSRTKRVPVTVFQSGRDGIAAFLSGYLDADGEVANTKRKQPAVIWSSVNRELLSDCQDLLAAIGFNATLFRDDATYKGEKVEAYRLAVYGREQISRLASVLDLTVPHKRERLAWWAQQEIAWTANVYEVDRIVSVEYIESAQTIAIEVNNHHTHITNGIITHNTTISAVVGRWAAETWGAYQEIYNLGNTLKQAKDRAFKMIKRSIQLAPQSEQDDWEILDRKLTHLPSGSTIEALPVSDEGEAGGNQSLTIWTELWGFQYEEALRFWDELQPVLTRPRSLRFVDTYAGYEGESELLKSLWNMALNDDGTIADGAVKLDDNLPIYGVESAGIIAYIDQGMQARRMPWQRGRAGREYYKQQENSERPHNFMRLHHNFWVSSVNALVPLAVWDALTYNRGKVPDDVMVWLAADASVRRDCAALCAVTLLGDRVLELDTWIWEWDGVGPGIDYDETLIPKIDEVLQRFPVRGLAYDEYQLHQSMIRVARAYPNVSFFPFPQGAERVRADTDLLRRIGQGKLRHSGNGLLKQHVLNSAAKEVSGGEAIRIVKRTSKKQNIGNNEAITAKPIDGIVTLSMAAYYATELFEDQQTVYDESFRVDMGY